MKNFVKKFFSLQVSRDNYVYYSTELTKMVQENPLSYIREFVSRIFQDVQITASNHRKNAAALRKFQMKCLNYNDCGENEFNKEFVRNVNRILPVRKGQANVERIINFIATFIKYCHEEGILVNYICK